MRPSPILSGRIKTRLAFTTKRVGGGFYRGNNTGSVGAHTQHGNYLVDWRKVRHFVVPNLSDDKLKPYVSRSIYAYDKRHEDVDHTPYDPHKFAGTHYLKSWKYLNTHEYEFWRKEQKSSQQTEQALDELENTLQIPDETQHSGDITRQ